ncbi:uncharacterized protein GIQ15_01650 [Arthroderma uncinatum]|uniref:uncharacterized protein n=1 Tax=Arthroderma uncinatum TaxID=74035 RepID=UPI00144A6542|nr:uncharacterized protein GIQ15_01650 [Arthroderma uncinatum]KAF3492133.1 hypothetical protein GIQ15_01650 [Arthroderma uncinatum]
MAPKWPQVNNDPEHINEHAAYLREACHQLQALGQDQVPWNTVQQYITSTIALVGKVLQQPAISDILHHIQDTTRCTQNIQRDVSIIKNIVGLSTAPPNATNPSGGRTTTGTWAQVAAQARGPPVSQSTCTTKPQPAVTAYKDRAVIVRLKDQGIIQRFRTLSATKIKQQVDTSIQNHAKSRSVTVVAAHQLKSGDIQIFTSSRAEVARLRESRGWVSGLGEHAELTVPTYGVIVHGISTNSINTKDQEATIQRILADNHTVIPKAEISSVGWLTWESTLKHASSIVVEFTDSEMANAIIYAGMAWDGQIHMCQLYDRACRVKQCFRCYNYGHIGTQCNAAQACGYCAELHETRNCNQKGAENFTPRCTVCKGAHKAWSNACPARKKEMERVEQAKQTRNTYWHAVSTDKPPKNDRSRAKQRPTSNPTSSEVVTISDTPNLEPSDQREPTAEPSPAQARNPLPELPSLEQAEAQADEDAPAPVLRQEPAVQQLIIDPQLMATEHAPRANPAEVATPDAGCTEAISMVEAPIQQPLYPPDTTLGDCDMDNAEEWLANLEDTFADIRHDSKGAGSIPTSMAIDTRTAQGLYKGCNCPEHQELYDNWPTRNAEMTIARCMKICVYCGKDFLHTSALRNHMRTKMEYIRRNLKEPWRNLFISISYYPLKQHFQLIYLNDAATRVCFYINKRINPGTWSVSHLSKDITSLTIRNPPTGRNIHIFNVYNEVGTDTLSALADAIDRLESHKEVMVLGDFNLHHPLWSVIRRRASYGPSARDLLTIVEDFQLQLLTVPGTTTHRWQGGESTIDLTFATEDLTLRLIHCKVDSSLDCDSDHLPIAVAIDWRWLPAIPNRKRIWAKTNVELLRKTVERHLLLAYDSSELNNEGSIDNLVSSIITAIDAGIVASTPWSNPSPRSIAGFDQSCKDLCTEVQQLRRKWQRSRQEDDYEAYRQACNKKGRHIRKTLRNTHRQRVEEASATQTGLWNLIKWAKNRHDVTPACTPALIRADGELVHQPEEKAEVLRQSFFPPPHQADLSDLEGCEYPPPIKCPEITTAEIERAVRKVSLNKSLGANSINNSILY